MRATTTLSARLERNLLAYATAASAAGVGVLSLASLSEAKVIYTPEHRVIKATEQFVLDLNHDISGDFTILNCYNCYASHTIALYALPAQTGNYVAGITTGLFGLSLAYALPAGAKIGPQLQFEGWLMASVSSYWGLTGLWLNINHHYLGLRFRIQEKVHYGWARLNVDVQGTDITATLTGYAYETIPNKAIIAGNRGSTTGQGPDAEPISLGRLALGASGRGHSQTAASSPLTLVMPKQ